MTTNVRIDDDLYLALKQASVDEGRPISQIIADAFAQYQRAGFWSQAKTDYERLRSDRSAWAAYQAEIQTLEGGSMDGVENEEPYYSDDEIKEILGTRD